MEAIFNSLSIIQVWDKTLRFSKCSDIQYLALRDQREHMLKKKMEQNFLCKIYYKLMKAIEEWVGKDEKLKLAILLVIRIS